MTRKELIAQINSKKSYLCVGLDTDLNKMPKVYPRTAEGMLAFNKMVIEETADFCVAYKPNLAFYEVLGSQGWEVLKATIAAIPKDCLVIADAKRGDIGNTASAYAKAVFDDLGADAVTVAPYMGKDAVAPFLEFKDKWTISLALTSNPGAADFQYHGTPPLYEKVIEACRSWGSPDQMMFVVGATRADDMTRIRTLAPDNFFLVPGIGAQGGDLEAISRAGFIREEGVMKSSNKKQAPVGLLVNSSRGIIFADTGEDHRSAIRAAARNLRGDMAQLMDDFYKI